jgi:DNA (cytosine-5)-methyltransferase 1
VNEKTHLDLFSGIGGFALAARWNGYRTLGFCDNEPYAQAVLKKHWPEVPCHKDIREVRGELYTGVTLLTGGFPCQPFSDVGRKRGQADDRYLWPEMFRVICEARPSWVLGENVAGIKNMALDQALSDLEGKDYEVQSFVIPACAVNAPHRRDRVWICAMDVAESKSLRIGRRSGQGGERWGGGRMVQKEQEGCEMGSEAEGCCSGIGEWSEESESSICRILDGVSNRVDRCHALGNAIVPQVAAEIIRCINQVMEDNK